MPFMTPRGMGAGLTGLHLVVGPYRPCRLNPIETVCKGGMGQSVGYGWI
jgi:hypothetical protein